METAGLAGAAFELAGAAYAPWRGHFLFTSKRENADIMGLFDDIDPGQFQDSGGILGRLLSWLPQANASQSGTGPDPQEPSAGNSLRPLTPADAGNTQAAPAAPDIGTRLGSGLQGWARTPAGSPFAAFANGINAFNNPLPANTAGASPSTAPAPAQAPNFGDRLGAALQSWAQTPVGSPFAGLANGITGFNTGQAIVSPVTAKPAQIPTPGNGDQTNAAIQNRNALAARTAANKPARRLVVISRSPPWPAG